MTPPPDTARPGLAMIGFWCASLSVGLAAFVALAALSHSSDTGGLADASAVLSVSFVLAVVPGAIQLRAAAAAAQGEHALGIPVALVAWLTAALLAATPLIATLLTVPLVSIALLAAQLPVACVAAVQRGTAIGREDYARASASMGVDAALRLAAGAGLGIAFGASGLAAALLLGTVAAALVGRGWYGPRTAQPAWSPARMSAASVLGPALTVGILMILINLDVLAAPRVLGAEAADAYAIAELPAKGVFFALFAVSWLAVPIAARSRTARELLVPIAGVLGLGVAATVVLAAARPLLPIALGDPAPTLGLLVALALAMSIAAALATALAMAVAREAAHPWAPSLLTAMLLGVVIVVMQPTAADLAVLVLVAQATALGGTVLGLLRTTAARALPAAGRPLAAGR